MGAVQVLLVDWTVKEYQIWVYSPSEQFIVEFSHLNTLANLFIVPSDLDFVFSENCAYKDGLHLGFESL